MKTCTRCNNTVEDTACFCGNCGNQVNTDNSQVNFTPPQQHYYQAPQAPTYAPVYDPYDHTAEFDAKDISENKVFCMLVYLMGAIGTVIALLARTSSPYVAFHVRQALKFMVVEILASLCAVLLFWTAIVPVAYAVLMVILTVIKVICFFQICSGKAKEPAIIRNLQFLR